MNKISLIVVLSLLSLQSLAQNHWKPMGVSQAVGTNNQLGIQNYVCSNDKECSYRLGTEWCCASAVCETSGYSTTSSQCNLWYEDGSTDLFGVKCTITCYASFVQAFGAAFVFYLLTWF